MCLNGDCFKFESFEGKAVAVIITGPGDLEYSWALESAYNLKRIGAHVTVIDISDFALKYSARIRFHGFTLPAQSRRVLRSLLLAREKRIETVIKQECYRASIEFHRLTSKKRIKFFRQRGKIRIADLGNEKWGPLRASHIIHSVWSSRTKAYLDLEQKVTLTSILEVKLPILETTELVNSGKLSAFDCFFLANGRQPVQAALTLCLRSKGNTVILYESGGGYIFPDKLKLHLDYWVTSPANPKELQEKIMCTSMQSSFEKESIDRVSEMIKHRSDIPYSLDFLTVKPEAFNQSLLGKGRNYTFFATSDWEISILHEDHYGTNLLASQIDAVEFILTFLKPEDRLFIRLHPSDPMMPVQEDDRWNQFTNLENVTIIPANSRVNSYELAGYMTASFVWVSFIGFELALRRLPIAVLGNSIYGPCLGDNWILSEEEMRQFINAPDSPKPQNFFYYSKYLAVGGFPIKLSRSEKNRTIYINDIRVDKMRKMLTWLPNRIRIVIT